MPQDAVLVEAVDLLQRVFDARRDLFLLGIAVLRRLGTRIEAWSEELGGGVLILVGVALAFGILG